MGETGLPFLLSLKRNWNPQHWWKSREIQHGGNATEAHAAVPVGANEEQFVSAPDGFSDPSGQVRGELLWDERDHSRVPSISILSRDPPFQEIIKNPGETAGFWKERWLKRVGKQPLDTCLSSSFGQSLAAEHLWNHEHVGHT